MAKQTLDAFLPQQPPVAEGLIRLAEHEHNRCSIGRLVWERPLFSSRGNKEGFAEVYSCRAGFIAHIRGFAFPETFTSQDAAVTAIQGRLPIDDAFHAYAEEARLIEARAA